MVWYVVMAGGIIAGGSDLRSGENGCSSVGQTRSATTTAYLCRLVLEYTSALLSSVREFPHLLWEFIYGLGWKYFTGTNENFLEILFVLSSIHVVDHVHISPHCAE